MADSTHRPIRVTISGSFNKHWQAVRGVRDAFVAAGCEVLSPQGREPERTEDGFLYLKGENGAPHDIERRHLDAIRRSDGLYVVSSGGYVGVSVALEIGYALAMSVPVWSSEVLLDVAHRNLVHVGAVAAVINELRAVVSQEKVPSDGVRDLQKYYENVARARDFSDETPEVVLMLLVEEVGELAKALRARAGVAMHEGDTSRKSVRLELADCLIYLLHMANQTNNDLYAAFVEKERLNAAKRWFRPRAGDAQTAQ